MNIKLMLQSNLIYFTDRFSGKHVKRELQEYLPTRYL